MYNDVQNLSKKSHGPTLMREKTKFKESHRPTTKRGARRGRRRVGRGRGRTKTKTGIKV